MNRRPATGSLAPDVSAVVGVRNCGEGLRYTLESLLSQDGVRLEVVVVDDGSTDATFDVLLEIAASDPRVKALRQPHAGLTHALRTGCSAARGEFIARQDAGPLTRALPDRLRKQAEVLRADPGVALVSCATRWKGPHGEWIEDSTLSPEEATNGLHRLDVRRVRGPTSHGATMFRRRDYEAVGGYREEFRVAQDLDLWLRLAERGRHVFLPEILVEREFHPEGTSGVRRALQVSMARLIVEAAWRRRAGRSESDLLAQAARLSRRASLPASRRARAQGWYYLGTRLVGCHPKSARRCFRRAVQLWPLDPRAWIRWASTRDSLA